MHTFNPQVTNEVFSFSQHLYKVIDCNIIGVFQSRAVQLLVLLMLTLLTGNKARGKGCESSSFSV